MELTFDPHSWLPPARASRQGEAAFAPRLDWPVLAARLSAAHAFQRHALRAQQAAVIARTSFGDPMREGSFDPAAARLLTGFAAQVFSSPAVLQNDESSLASVEGKVLADVNPNSSGDRKAANGMVDGVAGSLPSGNRGLK